MTPSVEPLAVHRIRHPLAARHRHLVHPALPTDPTAAASTPQKDRTR